MGTVPEDFKEVFSQSELNPPEPPYLTCITNDDGATWHIETTRDLTREELLDFGLMLIRTPLPKPPGGMLLQSHRK